MKPTNATLDRRERERLRTCRIKAVVWALATCGLAIVAVFTGFAIT